MGYTKGYDAIAQIYDTLNAEIDYEGWADFVEAAFDRFLPERPDLVLDLCCGTGSMTIPLRKRGYDMIGVDGSEDMLAVAYERSAQAGGILYLCQDMRSFELYGTVGAVTCCLDSINYLTGDGDLERCFATVHNYLDPEGVFLFDVNSPYKFQAIYGENDYILETENAYCGWQNSFHPETGLCDFALTVFSPDGEGGYRRRDEEQTERCYSLEALKKALADTGFEFLGTYGDFCFGPIGEQTERFYIAARCKKN